MNSNVKVMAVGLGALLLGCWLIAGVKAQAPNELRNGIFKIADLLEKGKLEDARKEAAAVAKKAGCDGGKPNSCEDLMSAFASRAKGGIGVGEKAGAIKPDDIELKIQLLGDDKKKLTPKVLMDEGPDIKKLAEISAAIGLITLEATPKKDAGKKKAADWKKWSEEMRDYGIKLSEAIDKKSPPNMVQVIARNLDSSCTSCHEVFRN